MNIILSYSVQCLYNMRMNNSLNFRTANFFVVADTFILSVKLSVAVCACVCKQEHSSGLYVVLSWNQWCKLVQFFFHCMPFLWKCFVCLIRYFLFIPVCHHSRYESHHYASSSFNKQLLFMCICNVSGTAHTFQLKFSNKYFLKSNRIGNEPHW